jgi:hypothetical protein
MSKIICLYSMGGGGDDERGDDRKRQFRPRRRDSIVTAKSTNVRGLSGVL